MFSRQKVELEHGVLKSIKESIMANLSQQQTADAIRQVMDCYRLCLQCAADCIDRGEGKLALCTKLCEICADSCALCVRCITSAVVQTKQVCVTCADICDACAAECDKGQGIMKECADACRACAATCRQMAA